MNFSEEQKVILTKSLLAKCGGKLVCPMCKSESSFHLYATPCVLANIAGDTMIFAMAECKTCGLLLQFNPKRSGIDSMK